MNRRAGERPLRLGYLVPDWPSQTHAFFWRELTALRARGHDVALFSTRRPPPDACRHAFAEQARAETAYLHPPRLRPLLGLLRRPARLIRALTYIARLEHARLRTLMLLPGAADLAQHAAAWGIAHVHGHSCATSAHLLALGAILGGFDYSLTLHGDLPIYGADHPAKMRHARFVAAVTRPLQHQLQDVIGLEESRAPLIPMGVDTARFAPGIWRDRPGFHVVTIARLNRTKGHLFALEAIAHARAAGIDIRYSIAGEGSEQDSIAAMIAALDLGRHVHMLGAIGEDAVLDLLHEADAFLLPSFGLGEAAPVSVMEAMACGLPVLCSRIGGVGDMIDHGETGLLFEQRDVPGLTGALVALAGDAALRARLGQAARAHAVSAFDHFAMADRLIAAIQGIPQPLSPTVADDPHDAPPPPVPALSHG